MTLLADLQIRRGTFELRAKIDAPTGVTVIFGPSGSGKTTALRALAGLDPGLRGTIRRGSTIWHDDDAEFVPTHRRRIGYVFQDPLLFPHLTVDRNVLFAARRAPRGGRLSLDEVMRLTGIEGLRDRDPATLSGGERQRVALARAMLSQPDVLLLDEPLASLDLDARQALIPALDACHRALGIPVVYVTHALDEVARLADRVILLDEGRVRASGPVSDVLTSLDQPLARRSDAQTPIDATTSAPRAADHLQRFEFEGGTLEATTAGELPQGTSGAPHRARQ